MMDNFRARAGAGKGIGYLPGISLMCFSLLWLAMGTVQAATLAERLWMAADARRADDPAFAEALDSEDVEDRRIAALAMARVGGEAVIDKLSHLATDNNKQVRHTALLGLSISGSERGGKLLLGKLTASEMETDTLGLVLKCLGNVGDNETQVLLVKDILVPMMKREKMPSARPLVEGAAEGLGLMWSYRRDHISAPAKEALLPLMTISRWSGDAANLAAFALSRIRFEKGFLNARAILLTLKDATEPRAQMFLTRAYGAQPALEVHDELMKLLAHSNEDVRVEAAAALMRDADPVRAMLAWNVVQKSKETRLLVAAIQALSEVPQRASSWQASLTTLAKNNADLRYSIERSLKPETPGSNEPETSPPATPTFEYSDIISSVSVRYRISTTRGDIVIEMQPDTPYTDWNFARLVEKKFYDGLLFHRVIPDFVAQGGDPKNDGSGGPDWQIREEISLLGHNADTLGMATNGKDTAGSQFFFNEGLNPHLDFHYTTFATVVSGREVIAKLVPGDKMVTVRKE